MNILHSFKGKSLTICCLLPRGMNILHSFKGKCLKMNMADRKE